MRVSAGLRLTESVTLVTTTVVRDTLSDCHFSAWSRPKLAPDPLPGPSVASGVIPTKGGRNGSVPATCRKGPRGPVAIQPLETLQPRGSQEQGSGSTSHR